MTPNEAKKLKRGDRLMIGGDIRGYVERVNKKSITFRYFDWLGILVENDLDKWNLPFSGKWNDITKIELNDPDEFPYGIAPDD